MYKIFLVLMIALSLLFAVACGMESLYIVTAEFESYQLSEVEPPVELVEEPIDADVIIISNTPMYIPIPPPPAEPRNATSIRLTLLINGTFTTFDAKNIDGANYFRFSDLQLAFEGVVLQEDELEQILRMAGDAGSPISEYSDNMYLNLRQLADFLGFRVAWVGSRNTIIIDADNSYAPYPVFIVEPLPEHIIAQITGSSFHPEAPFDYSHLSYLTITHVDFYGKSHTGNIIVAASIADEVLDIFREIYDYGFPIARMRLIDYYGADDYYSMADNNSVGFNFRVIAGTDRLSRHAWGMAIDINPIQNPFIRDDIILPVAGAAYVDRTDVRPGMIIPGDVVYRGFTSRGWTWGGHWRVPIDYHHFERR